MNKLERDLERLRLKINNDFQNEQTGHDVVHLENVLDYARRINIEEKADEYVIAVSALLHDIHRLMSTKEHYVTPKESLEVVEEILRKNNIDKIPEILYCIENHEDKQNSHLYNLETQILQDADALDAIGQRGLDRTLQYCKVRNIPVTNFEHPLDDKDYVPNINPISTCHFIYRTMIPNGKNLNTSAARKIAESEIAILERFIIEQYKKNGKTPDFANDKESNNKAKKQ